MSGSVQSSFAAVRISFYEFEELYKNTKACSLASQPKLVERMGERSAVRHGQGVDVPKEVQPSGQALRHDREASRPWLG